MRSSKTRSRNKSNRNRPVGNIVNRVFDSSGPEGKVRGTPQQIIEKYNQLARDAQLSNDRVATENFQQHAEHYLRLLGSAQKEQEARREQQERENRERQAERDRDRARRQERDSNADGDPAQAPQPDIVETAEQSDLVETPENSQDAQASDDGKPEGGGSEPAGKRSRKPRGKSGKGARQADGDKAGDENDDGSQDGSSSPPEAAAE